ncbi:MAG: phytoene desaturase [Ignavibacteriales bacterium]|nr:phytoene desaturase [Ignavibacteriales bacterium]
MAKKVLIVGAGIGGLATALRLVKRGFEVEILEKNSQAGGRLNQLKKDGFTFDTGPSFFSMSYEFKELADDCNIALPFETIELDPLYTVNFAGLDRSFILYKDIEKLAEQFENVEPRFEQKMKLYLLEGKRIFDGTVDIVVRRNFNSVFGYLFTLMKAPPRHLPKLFRNFWQQVSKYFSSDEVRQIISLVAFFLGRTPFNTPAVYTLLSYTEFQHDGYYNVKGGMYKIVEGFVQLLKKQNVKFHYNTEIVDYKETNGNLNYLIDDDNKKWYSDIYVINSDAALFRGKVFKRKNFSEERLDKMIWTMGPLTIYLGVDTKLPNVSHHNYYLGKNFRDYADKIFTASSIEDVPYYYVNVLSHTNPECAPKGSESLFFVCPVADLRYKPDWSDKEIIVDRIINDFSKRIKIEVKKNIVSETILTPIDWGKEYNLHRGSGLGLSHNLSQIGGFRPKNYDEKFKNVFYVGASTVPGTGLPMAIIGSKLVTERIEKYGIV